MNTTQKGIIMLLKSAVTGEKLALPEDFDMETAYPQIQRHHMFTLAYDGAVRCGVSRQSEVMGKLFQRYCKALLTSEGQLKQIDRIFRAFDENGIDYMPLKGCKMKSLYPKPELRLMGDADILIRMEQYEKIVPIMKSLGFAAKHESDHELVWQNDKLYLELHKRLLPSCNKDFHSYFGDGWQFATQKDGTRYSMTAEDEFVFLFTHFARHYRDSGIGCRHVVDLWVYLEANPGLDEERVKAELEKLQLLEFYENICRLMEVWFADAPTDEKTDFMTDFIFDSGSWGGAENRVLSVTVRDSKNSASGATGKLKYIGKTIFPSAEVLKFEYPILKKTRLVLPVIWCIRLVKKVLFERDAVERQRRSISVLTPEKLETRQQALNYVGLDFNF